MTGSFPLASRAVLLLAVLVAPVRPQSPASAPTSRPSAEILCENLRGGTWSAEDFGALIGTLVAEKRFLAADWWTVAAESALKSGKLPPKAKSKVAEIRTKIDHENQPSTEARLIWARAGEQVRGLIDKKAPAQAGAAVALVEQLAAAYPDLAWKRDAVALRQRVGKLADAPARTSSRMPTARRRQILRPASPRSSTSARHGRSRSSSCTAASPESEWSMPCSRPVPPQTGTPRT